MRHSLAINKFSIATKILAITLSRVKTTLQRSNLIRIAAAIPQLDVRSHSDSLVHRNRNLLTRRRYQFVITTISIEVKVLSMAIEANDSVQCQTR